VIVGIRLYQFIKFGCQLNVATLSLSCEMIGIVIRFISLLNFGLRRLYSYQIDFVLITLHIPFTIIPSFLLALFWHESLKSMKIASFLSPKTTTFFAVMCIITFVLELTSAIGRSIILNLFLIDYIVYPIEDIALSIFFFYNCYRVYQFLKGKEGHRNRKSRLQRMTFRIFLSAIGIVIFEFGFLLNLASILIFSNFILNYACILIFNNGLNITSIFHALAFSSHRFSSKNTSKSGGSTSKSKNKG